MPFLAHLLLSQTRPTHVKLFKPADKRTTVTATLARDPPPPHHTQLGSSVNRRRGLLPTRATRVRSEVVLPLTNTDVAGRAAAAAQHTTSTPEPPGPALPSHRVETSASSRTDPQLIYHATCIADEANVDNLVGQELLPPCNRSPFLRRW